MIRDEVIWITGASSGLGRALAVQLAEAGNRVIASARNEGALLSLAQESDYIRVVPFDVTDARSIETVREQIQRHHCALDRVILNAGSCEYLDMESPDWSMFTRVMTTNFHGMVNSIELALPLLKKATKPHLVGIGSQAVNAPFVRAEAYGASKAAVSYLLHSLRLDLARFNIDVTEIQPGFVDTPLTQRNDFAMPFLISAELAAEKIINAIARRHLDYAFPKRLSLLLWLVRYMPRWWLKINRRQMLKTTNKSQGQS
ncbi:MAG: SDR family NAD(P)-dependent oxidoreductase [Reinekea sp.]|jgi:short-subunit dehydrogenase